MYGNNNCNYTPCNCNRGGFFANYQAFWIIVVIAVVIIWVHNSNWNRCCGSFGGNNCGCGCDGYDTPACC